MRRIHLFEFGDKAWVPKFLRDYMTDFLEFGANRFNVYKDTMGILEKGLSKARVPRVVDMGSGGGGGWPRIIPMLKERNGDFELKLTDFNPNIKAFEKMKAAFPKTITYDERAIDATDVPHNLEGLRTMFLSFHHMKPNVAQKILQNAVDSEQPIAIFELQDRSIASLLAMFLTAPITAILTAPFIRPFSWRRMFFTFIIPILPLMIWFDGVVSNLRTYQEHDLKDLISKLDQSKTYEWEIGRKKNGPGFVLYLLGFKRENS